MGIGRHVAGTALRLGASAAILALGMTPAFALLPLARPAPFPAIDPGRAAPFEGAWSITIPTMETGKPDEVLAPCALPARIQAANDTHIFYLGPQEAEPDAAMELQAHDGGAVWAPIAGGPSFFVVWVSADMFYLYDEVPQAEADWGRPYVYSRCQPTTN